MTKRERGWGFVGAAVLLAIIVLIPIGQNLTDGTQSYHTSPTLRVVGPPLIIPAVHIGHATTVARPEPQVRLTVNAYYVNQCIQYGTSCRAALKQVINADRALVGSAPLALDLTMSRGISGGCVGSIGHSIAMAQTGTIWHVNAAYPAASFNNNICATGWSTEGQNVGAMGGTSKWAAIQAIMGLMMAEPWTPGCQENHHCNILYPGYTRLGIGIYQSGGTLYLTQDFAG